MSKRQHKIPEHAAQVQHLPPAIPAHRLLLLVRTKDYGSEGTEPVDMRHCPYYQQYGSASSCVSGSGGSMCGGFFGTTSDGETQCGWLPRWLLPGQRVVVLDADEPDPRRQQAGWN